MAIKDSAGNKVSAKIKAKLVLKAYLDAFDLQRVCLDFEDMKRTEPERVQEQIDKIIERMNKALVIK